jgi:hypothetical protein
MITQDIQPETSALLASLTIQRSHVLGNLPLRGGPDFAVQRQRDSGSKMVTGPPSRATAVRPVSLPVVCTSPGAQYAA